jgi:Zn-dependent peptidase ImmA (M78 family)
VGDPEIGAARETLAQFGRLYGSAGVPVAVDDVAESLFGLRIVECREIVESGVLHPDLREVRVNAGECASVPLRRRFTVAHEIGHWVLHAQTAASAVRFCRVTDVPEAPRDPREREANRFAAELLMPEDSIRAEVASGGLQPELLADRFAVSPLAMRWRLYNLGLSPDRPDQSAAPNSASTSSASTSSGAA